MNQARHFISFILSLALFMGLYIPSIPTVQADIGATNESQAYAPLTDSNCNSGLEAYRSKKTVVAVLYAHKEITDEKKNDILNKLLADCYFFKTKSAKLQYIHQNLGSNSFLQYIADAEGIHSNTVAEPPRPTSISYDQSKAVQDTIGRNTQAEYKTWVGFLVTIESHRKEIHNPKQAWLDKDTWRTQGLLPKLYNGYWTDLKAKGFVAKTDFTPIEVKRLNYLWDAGGFNGLAQKIKPPPVGINATGFAGKSVDDLLLGSPKVAEVAFWPIKKVGGWLVDLPPVKKVASAVGDAAGSAADRIGETTVGRAVTRIFVRGERPVLTQDSKILGRVSIVASQFADSELTEKERKIASNASITAVEQLAAKAELAPYISDKSQLAKLITEKIRFVTKEKLDAALGGDSCDANGCFLLSSTKEILINDNGIQLSPEIESIYDNIAHEVLHSLSDPHLENYEGIGKLMVASTYKRTINLNEGVTEWLSTFATKNLSLTQLGNHDKVFFGRMVPYSDNVSVITNLMKNLTEHFAKQGSKNPSKDAFDTLAKPYFDARIGPLDSVLGRGSIGQLDDLLESNTRLAVPLEDGHGTQYVSAAVVYAKNIFKLRPIDVISTLTNKMEKEGVDKALSNAAASKDSSERVAGAIARTIKRKVQSINQIYVRDAEKANQSVLARMQSLVSEGKLGDRASLDYGLNQQLGVGGSDRSGAYDKLTEYMLTEQYDQALKYLDNLKFTQ